MDIIPKRIAVPSAYYLNPLPDWLKLDEFYHAVEAAEDSPAKALILQLREKAVAEGVSPKTSLKELLNMKLFIEPESKTVRAECSEQLMRQIAHCELPEEGGKTVQEYFPHLSKFGRNIDRRDILLRGAVYTAFAGFLGNKSSDVINQLASLSPAWTTGGGVALGAVAAWSETLRYTERKVGSVKKETTRRSFLGLEHSKQPLDSAHFAYNMMNILNPLLHEQAISTPQTPTASR